MRNFTTLKLIKSYTALTFVVTLGACSLNLDPFPDINANMSATQNAVAIEAALDSTDLDVARQVVPTITGTGYATISAQPARNINQKRLMAIRVARLDAMRELTEQVHGLSLSGQTTVVDAVLQNDTTRATVQGTIRGARTVRINPVGSDTYEVVLELDRDMIARIMQAVR
ncbi:MAG: LPP20 family lipoprotein [Octadecabacter sp.]|nr:LPP20 family lipoprotein [Octadecabacter sp.]